MEQISHPKGKTGRPRVVSGEGTARVGFSANETLVKRFAYEARIRHITASLLFREMVTAYEPTEEYNKESKIEEGRFRRCGFSANETVVRKFKDEATRLNVTSSEMFRRMATPFLDRLDPPATQEAI